jgi:hypothetical protein
MGAEPRFCPTEGLRPIPSYTSLRDVTVPNAGQFSSQCLGIPLQLCSSCLA